MSRTTVLLTMLVLSPLGLHAQGPFRNPTEAVESRFASSQPVVSYTLGVDSADLSGFSVTLHIRNAPDTFRLAMMAHPEYDDRYWRFVEGLRVDNPSGNGVVVREDSALWRVAAPGGESVVRYRIHLPPPRTPYRSAWRPFLAATGGLVGGPHAFMYIVGANLAAANVALELPAGWDIATGLEPTSDPHRFYAPTIDILVDSPILVGRFWDWHFVVDGVPHRVVYSPLPNATPFDTTAFVGDIEKLVHQAIALFGRAPYREYTFLLQDGARGALEHLNSVTLGAPSAELAADWHGYLEEIAHEYFHAWNLMRIHPAEWRGIDYRPATPSRGLWFSEGFTMFYADLLLRRAGLPLRDSTRVQHLETGIARYLGSPGNGLISPERVSVAAFSSTPGMLGDYEASTHLQGELIGTMLDFIIRDATGGRRSIDDLMRTMLERFSGEPGFTRAGVERAAADVCGCATHRFFDTYVRGATPLDFNRYLALIGMRAVVSPGPALDEQGRPEADLRIWAWQPPGATYLRLLMEDPASVWGRAGFHTGDRLVTINGAALAGMSEFRSLLSGAKLGDTVRVAVTRPGGDHHATVILGGYTRPRVHVEEIPGATARQRTLRAAWLAGKP